MKVSEIRIYPPSCSWPLHSLIEVNTDEGLVGYAYVALGTEATAAIVRELSNYYPLLDAFQVVSFCQKLRSYCQANRNANHVVSAIEIALWDILGHYMGMPVHQLLGGAADMDANACLNIAIDCNKSIAEQTFHLKFEYCKAVRFCLIHGDETNVERLGSVLYELSRLCPDGTRLIFSLPATETVSLKWAKRVASLLESLSCDLFEVNFCSSEMNRYRLLSQSTHTRIGTVSSSISVKNSYSLIVDGSIDNIVLNSMADVGFHRTALLTYTAVAFGIHPTLRGMHDPLTLAANLHLTCLSETPCWVDIPSFDKLHSDFDTGIYLTEQGKLMLPACEGFGIRPAASFLDTMLHPTVI